MWSTLFSLEKQKVYLPQPGDQNWRLKGDTPEGHAFHSFGVLVCKGTGSKYYRKLVLILSTCITESISTLHLWDSIGGRGFSVGYCLYCLRSSQAPKHYCRQWNVKVQPKARCVWTLWDTRKKLSSQHCARVWWETKCVIKSLQWSVILGGNILYNLDLKHCSWWPASIWTGCLVLMDFWWCSRPTLLQTGRSPSRIALYFIYWRLETRSEVQRYK